MSVTSSVLAHAPAHTQQRSITILGATGSIGSSTIDLVRRGGDAYRVEAVTAANNAQALADLARALGARFAAIAKPELYGALKDALSGSGIEAAAGDDAVTEAAQRPAEWVMAAITGAAGLRPALAAADRGATVALANKECLVCAGTVFMRHAREGNATVLPVDSEHNAIFQALGADRWDDVKRIILTASGGPFRTWTLEQMKSVTLEQALKHPNWSMGPKITIDSATMMNKGLEIIEAHYIFDLPADKIDAIVHAQSLVHGIVEFRDGSMLAQMGPPDMRVPIACCLAWPHRMDGPARLDFTQMTNLTFEAPDPVRFPSLALARRALEAGGGAPTVLNAANEIASYGFIDGRIGFAGIPALVEATLEAASRRGNLREPDTLEDALSIDQAARALANELLPQIAVKAS